MNKATQVEGTQMFGLQTDKQTDRQTDTRTNFIAKGLHVENVDPKMKIQPRGGNVTGNFIATLSLDFKNR